MALTINTWLWGHKYKTSDLQKLANGLRRNVQQPFRLLCHTDNIARPAVEGVEYHEIRDRSLIGLRGCFVRLRMFHPGWQCDHGIADDERLACIDLDVVVTGPLDPVFDREEPFVILQGANAANPCPYNGSIWMLRAGYRPDVWGDFSLAAASQIPAYEYPDDQGWFHHKMPDAAGWKVGAESGVYAFWKPGWPKSDDLPDGARLVVFPGWRSPEKFAHLDWIKEHWQ